MKNTEVAIVACGKSSFAGSATIKLRFLMLLSRNNYSCHYISSGIPPESSQNPDDSIEFHTNSSEELCINSDSSNVILGDMLTESIIKVAIKESSKGKIPFIWGSALFPYGRACLNAKIELLRRKIDSRLMIFPVGADVWEIGLSLPLSVQAILDHPSVDHLATYSEKFASQITDSFGISNNIRVLPPYVDIKRFHKVSSESKSKLRKTIGLYDHDTVFICHSNMRPIKRLDATLELYDYIRKGIDNNCVLLLIGPHSNELTKMPDGVRHLGYQENVTPFLQASDFFINTSLHDSFNTALIEAVACGLVPITSSAPAVAESVIKYNCGCVFDLEPDIAEVNMVCKSPLESLEIPYYKVLSFVRKCVEQKLLNEELQKNGENMIKYNYKEEVCESNLLDLLSHSIENSATQ